MTGTRTKESSQRATVRTETVTRDEAERRGARNVGEALAGEATLQVNPQAYGYLGAPSGVQMQGLDGDRVLVLEDGERVIGDSGGVIDLAELPLSGVERIEYVLGPASALYGTNALGGVINVLTGPPRFEGRSARARVEGRTSGDWLSETAAAYRRNAAWAELDGSYSERHEQPLERGPALLVPSGYTGLVGLRVGFRPARRVDVRLKARVAHDRNDGVTTELVPGLGTYVIDTPETTDRVTLSALETLDLGHGSHVDFSLAQSFFRGESLRDRRNSPVDERRRSAVDLRSFETTATLADGQRTWVFGVRGESQGFSQTLHKVVVAGTALVPESAQEVVPDRLSSGAAYAELGYRITDAFSLMPGVRGELHNRYGAVVAPRLALAVRPSDLLTVRLSGGRGFRAPTAKEYGFAFDHSVLGYRVLGNRGLEPETSWGVSGDATVRPVPALRVRVGGFGNWVRDLIDFEQVPGQSAQTLVRDYEYRNVNRALTAGGDLSVRVEPAPGLVANVAYAYLYTRDEDAKRALPNRPPHTVTTSLAYQLPLHLNALVRYRVTARTFAADDELGNELHTPTYSLLDARLGYRLTKLIELYAGGVDLLDVRRDPHHAGDARPTLGRTFYLGVRGEFGDDGTPDASD